MKTVFSVDQKARLSNESLMVGIDIAKKTNKGYCRTPEGHEVKPFDFDNNIGGFNKFWKTIQTAMERHKLKRAIIGFESSGSYGEPLQHFLKDKPGVYLVQVNPMHTKRVKELNDNSPGKSDKKDPRVIVDIIRLGHFLSCIIPEGASAELRNLIHQRDFQIDSRTQMANRIHHLLHRVFPEFTQVIKAPLCETGRYLLREYTTPEQIASLDREELCRIMREKSRGKLGPGCALRLWEAARDSVGVKIGLESLCGEIRGLLQQIEQIEETVQKIEDQMPEYLEKISYSRRLFSIPDVSLITVAGVIGEVADFHKFSNQKALMKLAGLNLYERSSGKYQGEKHISKRGRPLLRKLLYFAALNTTRRGGIMYSKYQEMLARGMKKIKALVAISRKLLGLMYALVRDNRDYTHNYLDPSTPLRTRLRKAA